MKKLIVFIFLLISSFSVFANAGVYFNADNEVVGCGNSAAINNLAAGTICAWIYINTLANDSAIVIKGELPGTNDYFFWFLSDGDIYLTVQRATSNLQTKSNDTPLSTGEWVFVAGQWDSAGVDADQKCFYGDLDTLVAEVGGYETQTLGVGARAGGAVDLGLGGEPGGSPAWVNQDHIIAVVGLFDTNISLGQIKSFQYHPRKMANCVGLWFPGLHGATNVPDLSGTGNNGTIANATLDKHVPLRAPFGASLGFLGLIILSVVMTYSTVYLIPSGKEAKDYKLYINDKEWKDVGFIISDVDKEDAIYRLNVDGIREDFHFKPKNILDPDEGLELTTEQDSTVEVIDGILKRKTLGVTSDE